MKTLYLNATSICGFILLIFLWLLTPFAGYAAQQTTPDSTLVLMISQHRQKEGKRHRGNVRYLDEGAIVSLTLDDGRKINQKPVERIEEDHLFVDGEKIPVSSIVTIAFRSDINGPFQGFGGILSLTLTFLFMKASALILWIFGVMNPLVWILMVFGVIFLGSLFVSGILFRLRKPGLHIKARRRSEVPGRIQKVLIKRNVF